jgi:hypothetical protein
MRSESENQIDEHKEKMFHLIYEKYNSQPTPEGVWTKVVSGRPSQTYNVIKGDTLWDISKTLFGDGFFWSKIWSLNKFITNPHQIHVGQTIHFYQGMGLEPPSIDVKNSEPVTNEFLAKDLSSRLPPSAFQPAYNIASLLIPKSTRVQAPDFLGFPSSLPEWNFAVPSKLNTSLKYVTLSRDQPDADLSLTYFITEVRSESKGFISEVERGGSFAAERDYVFIEPNENINIGESFTAIKEIGQVKDPDNNSAHPKMIQILGELKVVGKVDNFLKAIVTKTIAPIEVNADIVKGEIPQFNMSNSGDLINQHTSIIGGEYDVNRTLMSLQSIVFLNKGTKDGLQRGGRLVVNANHLVRNPDSFIYDNSWTSAVVKIVRVEENYATGVILTSSDLVTQGDFTGEIHQSTSSKKSPKDDFLEGTTEDNFGDSKLNEDDSGGKPDDF